MTILEIVLIVLVVILAVIGIVYSYKYYEQKDEQKEMVAYYQDKYGDWQYRYNHLLKYNQDLWTENKKLIKEIKDKETEVAPRDNRKSRAYKSRKQVLQDELAEIELEEDYPLAYHIKHNDNKYIEVYINGKFKDKLTRDYAWEWAKKYANKYVWKANGNVYELSDKKEE